MGSPPGSSPYNVMKEAARRPQDNTGETKRGLAFSGIGENVEEKQGEDRVVN
jgi:hypothetical protein